ncbi:hypothetical protein PV326_000737 [Microctonus aethiopoides]|nr:hypothetical protein PV326_000737 [Microctonus aethiopoides]
MSLSIMVEESTLLKLSPALENVVKSLPKNATQNDYLIALIIVILKEVGLYPKQLNKSENSEMNIDVKQWMDGRCYKIPLEHNKYCELDCKLDAIPVGDTMILNLTSVDQSIKTRCIVVDTLEYVNLYSTDISSRFMNLKKFSHLFKDSLTTPIRNEILNDLGVMNPSLLGLPPEIQRKIAKMLIKIADDEKCDSPTEEIRNSTKHITFDRDLSE